MLYATGTEICQSALEALGYGSAAAWPDTMVKRQFINAAQLEIQRLTGYYKNRIGKRVTSTMTHFVLTELDVELAKLIEVWTVDPTSTLKRTHQQIVHMNVLREARLAAKARTDYLFALERYPEGLTTQGAAIIESVLYVPKGAPGLNDATSGGTFGGTKPSYYVVKITTAAGTDKFKWSYDNGAVWSEETAITGLAQTLNFGVTITFAATTGHTVDDCWYFTAYPNYPLGTMRVEFYPAFAAVQLLEVLYTTAPPAITTLEDTVFMPRDALVFYVAWRAALCKVAVKVNYLRGKFEHSCAQVRALLSEEAGQEPPAKYSGEITQ